MIDRKMSAVSWRAMRMRVEIVRSVCLFLQTNVANKTGKMRMVAIWRRCVWIENMDLFCRGDPMWSPVIGIVFRAATQGRPYGK